MCSTMPIATGTAFSARSVVWSTTAILSASNILVRPADISSAKGIISCTGIPSCSGLRPHAWSTFAAICGTGDWLWCQPTAMSSMSCVWGRTWHLWRKRHTSCCLTKSGGRRRARLYMTNFGSCRRHKCWLTRSRRPVASLL